MIDDEAIKNKSGMSEKYHFFLYQKKDCDSFLPGQTGLSLKIFFIISLIKQTGTEGIKDLCKAVASLSLNKSCNL
jgi:hypothetical protein